MYTYTSKHAPHHLVDVWVGRSDFAQSREGRGAGIGCANGRVSSRVGSPEAVASFTQRLALFIYDRFISPRDRDPVGLPFLSSEQSAVRGPPPGTWAGRALSHRLPLAPPSLAPIDRPVRAWGPPSARPRSPLQGGGAARGIEGCYCRGQYRGGSSLRGAPPPPRSLAERDLTCRLYQTRLLLPVSQPSAVPSPSPPSALSDYSSRTPPRAQAPCVCVCWRTQ